MFKFSRNTSGMRRAGGRWGIEFLLKENLGLIVLAKRKLSINWMRYVLEICSSLKRNCKDFKQTNKALIVLYALNSRQREVCLYVYGSIK